VLDDVLEIDDMLEIDDVRDQEDDLARNDQALLAWLNSPEFASAPPWERNQRDLHFHIALQTPDAARRRDLITNLERLECTVTTLEAETINGLGERPACSPVQPVVHTTIAALVQPAAAGVADPAICLAEAAVSRYREPVCLRLVTMLVPAP